MKTRVSVRLGHTLAGTVAASFADHTPMFVFELDRSMIMGFLLGL